MFLLIFPLLVLIRPPFSFKKSIISFVGTESINDEKWQGFNPTIILGYRAVCWTEDGRQEDEGGQVPQRQPHHDQQGHRQPAGL